MEQGASSTTCLGTPDLHMHRHLHGTHDLTALHPDNSAEYEQQPQRYFAAPTTFTSQLSVDSDSAGGF